MIAESDIEQYIDEHGMVHLLAMIENICHEKAEHVQTNWQDRTLASAWRRGAKAISARPPISPIGRFRGGLGMIEWFPKASYTEALHHAIMTARSFDGRFEIGLEKFSEYGKPGFRSGFILPRAENRSGFELRCEAIRATDPLPIIAA